MSSGDGPGARPLIFSKENQVERFLAVPRSRYRSHRRPAGRLLDLERTFAAALRRGTGAGLPAAGLRRLCHGHVPKLFGASPHPVFEPAAAGFADRGTLRSDRTGLDRLSGGRGGGLRIFSGQLLYAPVPG